MFAALLLDLCKATLVSRQRLVLVCGTGVLSSAAIKRGGEDGCAIKQEPDGAVSRFPHSLTPYGGSARILLIEDGER